jgi:hypothetical protein
MSSPRLSDVRNEQAEPTSGTGFTRRRVLMRTAFGAGAAALGFGSAAFVQKPEAAAAAVLAHAGWVHGSGVQIEVPSALASVTRFAFFTRVVGNPGTSNWLHLAVPTPVIVEGTRLRAGSVLIRFRTGSANAFVHAVHVYDGEGKIANYNGLRRAPASIETQRFAVPGNPLVLWGVGISLGVSFGSDSTPRNVDIVSAGCDFVR